MSNRVTIEPTEFKNVRSGEKTYGVRVYDDYDQSYDNTWDKIPVKDLDVLEKVMVSDDKIISAMMDFIGENEKGVCIGDNYYDWEDIKYLYGE